MPDFRKKSNNKNINNIALKICPACGFSFKSIDIMTSKPRKNCPQCGFKIIKPSIFPSNTENFDKRFI